MMPLTTRAEAAPTRRFSLWTIAVWVVLLLAGFGAVQYLRHAQYVSLVVAFAVIVICAGCILRQAWARSSMQVLAVLLAIWALVTAVLMALQWGDFELARQHAQSQPQLAELALWTIARAQRTWQVGLALKALAIPLLLWLAWQLGRPGVRAQFRRRS